MPPKASKRKAANGYRLPDPIPAGEVVTGLTKKKSWRVGKSIGVGGFGEIYLCSEDTSKNVGEDATLAMKIEPHENGPLFVEMNFYIRAAQPEKVSEFKKQKGLTSFGMPVHCGSGSHLFKGDKYRFLIMERFGKDLQKIFQSGKKKFPPKAAYTIAIKVLDTLEYIHEQGYVHNDIKAQNLLLGHGRTRENDVYLVDFGLVSKYHRDGVHLEYKPDARKAHDGTIEYTSRDAHIGAHSRRSDLEILAYNLVHWMSGNLPWMDNLTNCQYVQSQKNGFMNDIPNFLQKCFDDTDYPSVLEEFLEYSKGLEFDTKPDYDLCRDMFKKALKKVKSPYDGKLDFSTPKTSPNKKVGSPIKSPKKASAAGKRSVSPAKKVVTKKASGAKKAKESPKRGRGKRTVVEPSDDEDDDDIIEEQTTEEDEEVVQPTKGRKRASKAAAASPAPKRKSPAKKSGPAKKIKMEEKACQTSPAFVAEAKNARRAAKKAAAAAMTQTDQSSTEEVVSEEDEVKPKNKRSAKSSKVHNSSLSDNPEMEAFVSKAVKSALGAKRRAAGGGGKAAATEGSSADDSENDLSAANPTPAMQAMLNARKQKQSAGALRKSAGNGDSPKEPPSNPTPAMMALMKKRKDSLAAKKSKR